ncbi:MAG: RsmB/NOP family class I SAM-dependent RNA methyltransferase [Candidatus Nezhaarchaeota archaeon]|nr:RsmB/NOP family class I SAM-dependent RNA methyltransferase [Candidatus Nezhaarchaeota archaeon]
MRVNKLRGDVDGVERYFENLGFEVKFTDLVDDVLLVRPLGPFEIPETPKKVVVDKFTAESVMVGADVYVPGIKNIDRVREGDLVNVLDPRGRPVAMGRSLISSRDLPFLNKGLAVKNLSSIYKLPPLRSLAIYASGLIYPQSLPSVLAVRALDPKEGEVVVDLNAAPGGKLTYASQLMGNKGLVIGIDRSPVKVERLNENIKRLGVKNARTMCLDSRYADRELSDLRGKVDAVMVDPPCSALGVRPKLYDDLTDEKARDLSNYQKQFVTAGLNLLKRGGRLLYSVCTMCIEECEEIIEYAAKVHNAYPLDVPRPAGDEGLRRFSQHADKAVRFHPHIHGTPGFFYVVILKGS